MSEELKVQRTRDQWAKCEPKLMAQQSQAAIMYALQDARRDIESLYRQADQLRSDLSHLKAGQGEAVEIIAHLVLGGIFDGREYGDIDYQIEPDIAERLQQKNVKTAEDVQLELMTVAQHERIVAAITASPPSDPGTVPVRPELLDSCQYELASWMRDHGDDIKSRKIVEELRALLVQHEGEK